MRHVLLCSAALFALSFAACAKSESEAEADTGAAATRLASDEAAAAEEAGLGDMQRAIEAMYADIDAVDMTNPPLPMTDELSGLFAAERAAVDANAGEPQHLDSAWVIGGAQDYELGEVTVTEEPIEPGMTMLVASFTNFGEPQKVRYVFKQQDGAWLLDDIVLEGPGDEASSIADTLRGF